MLGIVVTIADPAATSLARNHRGKSTGAVNSGSGPAKKSQPGLGMDTGALQTVAGAADKDFPQQCSIMSM